MGWAHGVDGNGREIGYGVAAVCDEPGCIRRIDRGLAFRCGPLGCETETGAACGNYYCGHHLYLPPRSAPEGTGGLCARCLALTPDDDEDDDG